jgi:hypothetical protein
MITLERASVVPATKKEKENDLDPYLFFPDSKKRKDRVASLWRREVFQADFTIMVPLIQE